MTILSPAETFEAVLAVERQGHTRTAAFRQVATNTGATTSIAGSPMGVQWPLARRLQQVGIATILIGVLLVVPRRREAVASALRRGLERRGPRRRPTCQ